MLARIQKWGNSLALRIPAAFARETDLHPGTEVDLALEEGRLIIAPRSRPTYALEALLAAITEENRHEETDSGSARGREAW